MFDVVALGELLIDFASVGDDCGYPIMAAHPGGAPANFLAAVESYGLSSALISKVGDDAFGDMLIRTVREKGIDASGIIKDSRVFTTLAFVTFTPDRDRIFSFSRKPGADTMLSESEIDETMLRNCHVFHFGTLSLTDEPSRSASFYAVKTAKQSGALISFDPNYRAPLWKSLDDAKCMIDAGLRCADIVKISDEEAALLFGVLSDDEIADILLSDGYGVKLLYVTKGRNGSFYATASHRGRMGIYDVGKPIDTTGAGDIFGGSAMAAFLKKAKPISELTDADLSDIVHFATVASGLSTMKTGGISSVPALDDVMHNLGLFRSSVL